MSNEIGYIKRETLTDIANAIRSKGFSTQMKPYEMPYFIREIDNTGIHPTGTINITQNGITDVTQYAEANVQIPRPTGTYNITQNGVYDVENYRYADVQTPTVNDYFAPTISSGDSSNSGLNKCITRVPDGITVNGTSCAYMFAKCISLVEIGILNTSNVTDMSHMFDGCTSLQRIPSLVTSNVTNVGSMFYGCTGLINVVINYDLSLVNNYSGMFRYCSSLNSIEFNNTINTNVTINVGNLFTNCTGLSKMDLRYFDFTMMGTTYSNMFGGSASNGPPDNCLVIVADDTQKTTFLTYFSRFTNVKTVAEYEA